MTDRCKATRHRLYCAYKNEPRPSRHTGWRCETIVLRWWPIFPEG